MRINTHLIHYVCYIRLPLLCFAPGKPFFEAWFDLQCTEISIKGTLTPNKIMHVKESSIGPSKCYLCFTELCNASMLKQQDSLGGKNPQMQYASPPATHGHPTGTGNSRTKAVKLMEGRPTRGSTLSITRVLCVKGINWPPPPSPPWLMKYDSFSTGETWQII